MNLLVREKQFVIFYNIYIVKAADDQSERVFRPTRNMQAMDMLDQHSHGKR